HRLDRFCPRGDLLLDLRYIEVVSFWIDVHKHGRGAEPRDRADGREETVWRRYHLVVTPDVQCHQRQQDRIAARSAPDSVLHAAILRQLPLKRRDFPAQNKPVRIKNAPQRGLDLWAKKLILFL